MTTAAPMLRARGVTVLAGGRPILEDASLDARAGELVAVVGPNGAGKSTLLRSVAGLQKVAAGEVLWQGATLRGRKLARVRAFVPQRPNAPDGVLVRDAVMLGRAPHIGPFARPVRADRDAVDRALERTGAAAFADRSLSTLSGGELQRVAVAVALAQDAPALLLDEPTSSLDLGATAAMARLLRALADDGLAVVLVVHDLALAAAVADRVVVVAGGRTVADGPPHDALDRARLADVWQVDATLDADDHGRTALRVAWLDRPRPAAAPPADPRPSGGTV